MVTNRIIFINTESLYTRCVKNVVIKDELLTTKQEEKKLPFKENIKLCNIVEISKYKRNRDK